MNSNYCVESKNSEIPTDKIEQNTKQKNSKKNCFSVKSTTNNKQYLRSATTITQQAISTKKMWVTYFIELLFWTIECVTVLNDIKDLKLLSLGTLVLAAPCSIFYITRDQIYWSFDTDEMVFATTLIWYHLHRKTHAGYTRLTRVQSISHHLLFTHNSYLNYTEWKTCW